MFGHTRVAQIFCGDTTNGCRFVAYAEVKKKVALPHPDDNVETDANEKDDCDNICDIVPNEVIIFSLRKLAALHHKKSCTTT
jgi:hypothetical protein